MNTEKNPLWTFSLALYPMDEVKSACLALQSSLGADINIVLLCCWLGVTERRQLTEQDMDRILVHVCPWHHEVVKGLRKVRQLLKGGYPPASPEHTEAVRQNILRTEIEAEWIEQNLLFALTSEHAPAKEQSGWAIAAANILLYFSLLGVQVNAQDKDNIRAILVQAFPDENGDVIFQYLQRCA